jgi:hypothetical protein
VGRGAVLAKPCRSREALVNTPPSRLPSCQPLASTPPGRAMICSKSPTLTRSISTPFAAKWARSGTSKHRSTLLPQPHINGAFSDAPLSCIGHSCQMSLNRVYRGTRQWAACVSNIGFTKGAHEQRTCVRTAAVKHKSPWRRQHL